MRIINILVLGFSVTADYPSYVEIAQKMLGQDARYKLSKVAIGGVTLEALKYLVPEMVRDASPDVVVLEIGTTGVREWSYTEVYEEWLQEVVNFIGARSIPILFLDFPRCGVEEDVDWQPRVHERFARSVGAYYRKVNLDEGVLRDYVHPTPRGHEYYASVLLDSLDEFTSGRFFLEVDRKPVLGGEASSTSDAALISNLVDSRLERSIFSRGGYKIPVVSMPAGAEIIVPVPSGSMFCGITYCMGPRTGGIHIIVNRQDKVILAFDRWSYYERLGAYVTNAEYAENIIIKQLPEVPSVSLDKGVKDTGPRVGKIGHILLAGSS